MKLELNILYRKSTVQTIVLSSAYHDIHVLYFDPFGAFACLNYFNYVFTCLHHYQTCQVRKMIF